MTRNSRGPKTECPPEARYVNYFEVGHNAFEFIVHLGQYHPEHAAAQFHLRVVTGPIYAKLLSNMLADAIQQHELEHGVIEVAALNNAPFEAVTANGSDNALQTVRARRSE